MSRSRTRGPRSLAALMLAVVVVASGCSSGSKGAGSDGTKSKSLVVYSGQHEDLTQALAAAFEKESGITLEVRSGDDAGLVNQIIEEGDRSKADVVLTEEPGPIAQLDAAGLLAKVDSSTLAKVDSRFSPKSGNWLAWAARVRVMLYNPNLISEDELPKSVLELSDPEWKGRFAYAPSGAFVTTVNYLIDSIGEDKTLEWLKGIKANGVNEQKNGKVRDSVEAGQHEFGLANHYYWYILAREKGGEDALQSRVHYVDGKDAGGLVLASGAGVLKSSKNQETAQQFMAWLADRDGGQQIVAKDTPQYPTVDGVTSSYDIRPLSELDPPEFDQGSLSEGAKAKELMVKAGLI
ncbi:MAG: extracellular solute-binding protein [Microthrixaceae bacterium]|nr:extracellular solute-binding protein [Microthrixaceae bacterium]